MSEEKTKLSGPDLTQGVDIATIPDGTMLLGHAQGEPVLLARRGDEVFAIGRSVHTTVLRSNRGSSWAIRFDARGIMPASACGPVRLSVRQRWIPSRVGALKRCATWRVSSRRWSSGLVPSTFGKS